MNLGFRDIYHHVYDTNHYTFFQKDTRNIYIYSTNYEYLGGETYKIVSRKEPNIFDKERPNDGITFGIIA